MRMYSASGRSLWPYVIGAAVVVVAVGGGLAYANTRGDSTPTAIHTTSPASSAPTPAATGGTSGGGDNEGDAAPTGCLGGQDRTAAMVLAAQKSAGHSSYGAVEVATSFYRWLWQYPYPSASEAQTVSAAVVSPDAASSLKNIEAQYQAAGDNPTQGVVPPGGQFFMSTTNGVWSVLEGGTPDRVTVQLAAGYVIDGALSPTKTGVSGYVMVWQNGAWHISTGTPVDQTKLANAGTRFTGGC
jgi:hypothetical protein